MRILTAELRDFRNIARAALIFSPQLTVFTGLNGHGKTNTLEALYFLAALRPLRNVPLSALLRTGTGSARISASVESVKTGLKHDLAVELDERHRVLLKDSKRVHTSTFLGTLVVISFTPEDLQLFKGGPDPRRRMVDRALLNLRPVYLDCALRYAKAVRDRNRLLVTDASDKLLDVYDEMVAMLGTQITLARASYLEEIAPRFRSHFERIAAPAPSLHLAYQPSILEALDLASEITTVQNFLRLLAQHRPIDRRRRTTSIGPHLDDVSLMLDQHPARERASQGQHRAITLALKLAELENLNTSLGEPPVLLLDDMSSELDPERSRQLFEVVKELNGQIVITSTEPPRGLFSHLTGAVPDASRNNVRRYNVREGVLS